MTGHLASLCIFTETVQKIEGRGFQLLITSYRGWGDVSQMLTDNQICSWVSQMIAQILTIDNPGGGLIM